MNADALRHAAQTCRAKAQVAEQDADMADLAVYRCKDVGPGTHDAANGLRDTAIGLRVAASFIGRCARCPEVEQLLSALERGETIHGSDGRVLCGAPEPTASAAQLRPGVLRFFRSRAA